VLHKFTLYLLSLLTVTSFTLWYSYDNKRAGVFVACSALEEADKELLENNRVERGRIEQEINELRERNVSITGL